MDNKSSNSNNSNSNIAQAHFQRNHHYYQFLRFLYLLEIAKQEYQIIGLMA